MRKGAAAITRTPAKKTFDRRTPRHSRLSPLCGQLRAQHFQWLDDRWRGKQHRCLRHQGLRDWAAQVTLSPAVISEGIEDGERSRTQPQREPQKRGVFLIGEREAVAEKLGNVIAALTAKYLIVDSRPSQSAYVLTDHLIHNDPLVERFERWARTSSRMASPWTN
jgi:hypothetical protein